MKLAHIFNCQCPTFKVIDLSINWAIPAFFLGDEWKFLPTGIQEQVNFHERTRGKINKDNLFCFLYLTLLYVVNNNDHDNRKYKHSRYVMSKIHTRHTSSSTHHQPLSSPHFVCKDPHENQIQEKQETFTKCDDTRGTGKKSKFFSW